MKPATIALSLIILVMSVNPSEAGRRHGRHHNSHYRSYGHSYNYRHDYGHYGHYSYGHRGYYGYYGNYGHGRYAAYALGGLIAGGIIGATISSSLNSGARYPDYREPVYVTQNPVNSAIKPSYIIQPDGSCYVISHVNNGSLVLAPVSSGHCE